MASLGMTVSQLPVRTRVLLLEKKGKRRIENTKETITHLKSTFHGIDVDSFTSTQLEQMPIKQQVMFSQI